MENSRRGMKIAQETWGLQELPTCFPWTSWEHDSHSPLGDFSLSGPQFLLKYYGD